MSTYHFGWSDPRKANSDYRIPVFFNRNVTGFEDAPTEVLKNLWLVRFGEYEVNTKDLPTDGGEDILRVGQELANRNLVLYEKRSHPDRWDDEYYYVLEKTSGDS